MVVTVAHSTTSNTPFLHVPAYQSQREKLYKTVLTSEGLFFPLATAEQYFSRVSLVFQSMVETPMPKDGANIRRRCNHCETEYTYVLGSDEKHSDNSYCPACLKKRVQYSRASGTMRISNENLKEAAAEKLGELPDVGVWVDQTPAQLFLVTAEDDEIETPVITGVDE